MGAASAALFFCVGDSDTIAVGIRRYTMVKHIILWQYKDELTDDRKKELGNEIKEKLVAIGELLGFESRRLFREEFRGLSIYMYRRIFCHLRMLT